MGNISSLMSYLRRAFCTSASKYCKPLKMSQPPWSQPTGSTHQPQLKIYNSLTRSKVPFVPLQPEHITWYACGPTVYDDSHLGHARNYVTTDIIRRILRDYFHFKVHFVMNITDVDDKIILRGRQRHLYDEYKKNHRYIDDKVRQDVRQAWHYYIQKNLKRIGPKTLLTPETFDGVVGHFYGDVLAGGSLEPGTKPGDKEAKVKMHINTARSTAKALLQDPKMLTPHEFYNRVNDPMCLVLDDQFGKSIQGDDYAVFTKLTKEYENRFFQDMHDLNVLDPDDLVRVTENGKEIAEFVKKIADNNMAYRTSDGSVYFDIKAFEAAGYPYARLEPWNRNDKELQADGEGALSQKDERVKRSEADFALWKASKPGEPSWDSQWGPGRPGWHIECSAMASGKLGRQMDIHSGGIDLAFPHHDNELAQSEAFWADGSHRQWVNYFLHMGHLSIQGSKMSKSLKNFTTIREAIHVQQIVSTSPGLEEPPPSGRPRPSYARALSQFSKNALEVTAPAESGDLNKQILALCDRVRDVDLWQLDIYLEDRENAPALVRPVTEGLRAVRREREEKALAKEKAKKKREQEALEKLQKGKISPTEMFKPPHSNEYSAWDQDGVPTVAKESGALSANRIKKLKKEWDAQRKAHEKYLAVTQNGSASQS